MRKRLFLREQVPGPTNACFRPGVYAMAAQPMNKYDTGTRVLMVNVNAY